MRESEIYSHELEKLPMQEGQFPPRVKEFSVTLKTRRSLYGEKVIRKYSKKNSKLIFEKRYEYHRRKASNGRITLLRIPAPKNNKFLFIHNCLKPPRSNDIFTIEISNPRSSNGQIVDALRPEFRRLSRDEVIDCCFEVVVFVDLFLS